MLHPDVELIGLSGEHLSNWWRVALPGGVWSGRWGLVVRSERGPVAVVKDRGRVELDEGSIGTSAAALAELRDQLRVDLVVVADDDALARVAAMAEPKAARQGDFVAQWLAVYDALRRLRGKGIWSDPPLLDILPPLRHDALGKALQLLVPNQRTLVSYVFDGGRLHASAIATVAGGMVDSFAMHPAIEDAVPASALRTWSQGYGRINEVVSERFGKPAISVFAELEAIRRIQSGPPEQLSRELSAKKLIIDPMPAWLAGLVGGAAAAAIASKGAQTLSKFLPKRARAAAEAAASVAKDRLREAGPLSVLGFDPILLWQTVQRYYR